MLELDAARIGQWVFQYLLPLFRISAFLMLAPIFGTQMVPARVRAVLALAITVLVASLLPDLPPMDALSPATWLLVSGEILLGVGLALLMQLFMQAFILAGQAIAMQMGLGFASLVDPGNGVTVAVLGQFYILLVTLLLLGMNGHLVMIDILVQGFTAIPPGSVTLGGLEFDVLFQAMSWMMVAALLLCLPAVTALLVVNMAFGVMTRAAPQLNIFSLGFPMALLFGMFVWWVSLADLLPDFSRFGSEAFDAMRQFNRLP